MLKFLIFVLATIIAVKADGGDQCVSNLMNLKKCIQDQIVANTKETLKQLVASGQQCIDENADLKVCNLKMVMPQQGNVAAIQIQQGARPIPAGAASAAVASHPAAPVQLPALTDEQKQKLKSAQQCFNASIQTFATCMKEQLGEDFIAAAQNAMGQAGQDMQEHPLLAPKPGAPGVGPAGGNPLQGKMDNLNELGAKICSGNAEAFETLKKCALKKAAASGQIKNLVMIADPILGACNALNNSNCMQQYPISDDCKQKLMKGRDALCSCKTKAIEFANSSSDCESVKQDVPTMKAKAEEFLASHQQAASAHHDLPFMPTMDICSLNKQANIKEICQAEAAKITAKIEQFKQQQQAGQAQA